VSDRRSRSRIIRLVEEIWKCEKYLGGFLEKILIPIATWFEVATVLVWEMCPVIISGGSNMNGELLGLPDGYRAVRFGPARLDDVYMDHSKLREWNSAGESHGHYLIVEKSTPAKPKTRSVVLNRYLVWDDFTPANGRVVECEESYVIACWHNFKLLGHSETIEVEV